MIIMPMAWPMHCFRLKFLHGSSSEYIFSNKFLNPLVLFFRTILLSFPLELSLLLSFGALFSPSRADFGIPPKVWFSMIFHFGSKLLFLLRLFFSSLEISGRPICHRAWARQSQWTLLFSFCNQWFLCTDPCWRCLGTGYKRIAPSPQLDVLHPFVDGEPNIKLMAFLGGQELWDTV